MAAIFCMSSVEARFRISPKSVQDTKSSREIATKLVGKHGPPTPVTFVEGLYPPEGTFTIGSYGEAFVYCDQRKVFGCTYSKNNKVIPSILSLYSPKILLAVELQSTVNHFGYAYYIEGQLVRAFAGNEEDGILVNIGSLLSEEADLFSKPGVERGEGRILEVDTPDGKKDYSFADGESLVSDILARVLTEPYLEFDGFDLQIDLYRPPWWKIW